MRYIILLLLTLTACTAYGPSNTTVTVDIGTLSGVDMPTSISTSGANNFMGLGNSLSGEFDYSNGQTVKLRTNTLPYNTDVSGLPADSQFGKTNSKTVPVTTPSGTFNVTFTTKAPVIKENFDFNDVINKYPFEDIDVITNTPLEYATSAQITADDIQISQEIKVDQADAQVSINNGTWQSVREI